MSNKNLKINLKFEIVNLCYPIFFSFKKRGNIENNGSSKYFFDSYNLCSREKQLLFKVSCSPYELPKDTAYINTQIHEIILNL